MKLFLSYNTINKPFVESVAHGLVQNCFEIFYDTESIAPGDIWTKVIQKGIESSNAALVFIGEEGIGAWQNKEVLEIVDRFSKDNGYKVIPVILTGNNKFIDDRLPWFLRDHQWVEYKDKDDNHAFEKLLERLREQDETDASFIGKNPYKGLESFGEEDEYSFFGRTFDLNRVFHDHLRFDISIPNHNFLAVVADSGTGKSSFMQAGILASLKNGKFSGSEKWKQIIFKPCQSPLSALSSVLKQENLTSDSRQFEENAKKYDDQLLRTIRDQRETWVIYIDQFEEIITQCRKEEEKAAFLNNIARAIETEKAVILLSLRSDFYTAFGSSLLFKGILEKNNYTLSGIEIFDADETKTNRTLRDIIIRPAKNAGVTVDSNLVETIINEIKEVKGALPILELTLDLLWKNRKNLHQITLDDFATVSKKKTSRGSLKPMPGRYLMILRTMAPIKERQSYLKGFLFRIWWRLTRVART